MKRRFAIVPITVIFPSLLFVSGASAQDNLGNYRGMPHRIHLHVGGLAAQDSVSKANNNTAWFLFSASYDLQNPSSTRLVDFSAYLDAGGNYNRERKAIALSETMTRSFTGIGIATYVRLSPPGGNVGIYGTAGIGGYYLTNRVTDVYTYQDINYFGEDTQQEYRDTLYSRSRLSLGYKLGGGVRFGRGLSLEAAYYNLGKLQDIVYSGVGITFGLRL